MLGGQRSLQTAGGSWSGCAHFVSPVCHRDGDIVTKYQNYIDKMSILDVTHIRSPLDGDIFQVLSRLKCAKFGIEPDTGWVWLSSRHLGIPDVHGTQGSQVVPLGFFFSDIALENEPFIEDLPIDKFDVSYVKLPKIHPSSPNIPKNYFFLCCNQPPTISEVNNKSNRTWLWFLNDDQQNSKLQSYI